MTTFFNGGKMSPKVSAHSWGECLTSRKAADDSASRRFSLPVRRSWQLTAALFLAVSVSVRNGLALMLPGGVKLPPPAPLAMRQRTTKLRDPETGAGSSVGLEPVP